MKQLDKQTIDAAFRLLELELRRAGFSPVHLIVCGGSALIATDLVSRTTRDVDVLAFREPDGHLVTSKPFPGKLHELVREIGRHLDIMEDWLNPGPASLFEIGMPAAFETRLILKTYGSHLSVSNIGRLDQIYLKLYAALNFGAPSRHVADLKALAPTSDELLAAVDWTLKQDASEEFPGLLRDMLRKIGYADVAERF